MNDQPLNLPFQSGTDENCNDYGESSGTVHIGSGTHELKAWGGNSSTFATAQYTYTATVQTPPTAVFSYSPNPAVAGSAVTLDGSGSYDAESPQLAHHWERQDEAENWTRSGSGPTVQATWGQAGIYQVHLWVLDDAGARDDVWATVTDRGACVVVAVGAAAYECGDLRLGHALPATRVLNRVRAPTLVYSSTRIRTRSSRFRSGRQRRARGVSGPSRTCSRSMPCSVTTRRCSRGGAL